jgi:hypothetical protein
LARKLRFFTWQLACAALSRALKHTQEYLYAVYYLYISPFYVQLDVLRFNSARHVSVLGPQLDRPIVHLGEEQTPFKVRYDISPFYVQLDALRLGSSSTCCV